MTHGNYNYCNTKYNYIKNGQVKLNKLKWAKLFVKYVYIIRVFTKYNDHVFQNSTKTWKHVFDNKI